MKKLIVPLTLMLVAGPAGAQERIPDEEARNIARELIEAAKKVKAPVATDVDVFSTKLPPRLACAVHAIVLIEDAFDLHLEFDVSKLACRCRPAPSGIERRRGDRAAMLGQHPADRLDPKLIAMLSDVVD